MGSDMSKPRKNKNNVNSIYSHNNQNQLMRTPPNQTVATGKHLVCKEIDLPLAQQQQSCTDGCNPNINCYSGNSNYRTQQHLQVPQQLISQPMSQQQQVQLPQMPQYMNLNLRPDCYDQYQCREDRDIYYRETDMIPLPMQYHPSPSRSRCYYDDQIINNATRSDRQERSRSRAGRRSAADNIEDDYIERYEIPLKEPASTARAYKPTYQYYDDLETNAKPPIRYRSKSTEKFLETKDYSQFDDLDFTTLKYKDQDTKSKLQSRSVYFIKDGDSYECTPTDQSTKFKNLYDSGNTQKRSHSIARTPQETLPEIGYDYKTTSSKYSSRDATVPLVNVVNSNTDIVYVPMVKTEFIKRESQKIENLGNLAYQSQAYSQQENQSQMLKTTKSDLKKMGQLSKYIHLENIESTMIDELDSQRKSSKLISMQSDEPGYKPILKKATNSELDSDSAASTTADANRSKILREKLRSEFHDNRQARNYFNNVQYNPELMASSNSGFGA